MIRVAAKKNKPPHPVDASIHLTVAVHVVEEVMVHGRICKKFNIDLTIVDGEHSGLLRSKRYFSFHDIIQTLIQDLKFEHEDLLELSLLIFQALLEKQICFEIDEDSAFWEIAHAHLLDQLITPEMCTNIEGCLDRWIIKTQYWQNNALFLNKQFITSIHQSIDSIRHTEDAVFCCEQLISYLHQHCKKLTTPYVFLLYSFVRRGNLFNALNLKTQSEVVHYLCQHSRAILDIQHGVIFDKTTLKNPSYLLWVRSYDLNIFFDLKLWLQNSPAAADASIVLPVYNIADVLAHRQSNTLARHEAIYLIDSEIWQKNLLDFLLLNTTIASIHKTIILSRKPNLHMTQVITMEHSIIIEYSFIQELLFHPAITSYLLTREVINLQNPYDIHERETWNYWLNRLKITFSTKIHFNQAQTHQFIFNQLANPPYTPDAAMSLAWQSQLPKVTSDYVIYFVDAWSLDLKTDLLPFLHYVMSTIQEMNKDKSIIPCIVFNTKPQKKAEQLQSVIFDEFDLILSAHGEQLVSRDPSLESKKSVLVIYEEIPFTVKQYLIYEVAQKELFLSSGELWFSLVQAGKYPLLWKSAENASIDYLEANINYILHSPPTSSHEEAKKILFTLHKPLQSRHVSLNHEAIFSAFNQKLLKWMTPPTEVHESHITDDDVEHILDNLLTATTQPSTTVFAAPDMILQKDNAVAAYPNALPLLPDLEKINGSVTKIFPMEFINPVAPVAIVKRTAQRPIAQPLSYYFETKAQLISVKLYDLDTYLKDIRKADSPPLIFAPVFKDDTGKIVQMHFKYFILHFTRELTEGKVKYQLVCKHHTEYFTKVDICNVALGLMPQFIIGEPVVLFKELLNVFYQLNIPIHISKVRNYNLVMSIILNHIEEFLHEDGAADKCQSYLNYLNQCSGLPAGLLTVIEQLHADKSRLFERPDLLTDLSIHPIIYRSYLTCIRKLPLSNGLYDSFMTLVTKTSPTSSLQEYESDEALALQITSMINLKSFISRSNPNREKHVVISIIPAGHGDLTFSRQFVNTLATIVEPGNISWICLFYRKDKMLSIPAEMIYTTSAEISYFALEFSNNDYKFLNATALQRIIGATIWLGPTCLHLNNMQMNFLENLSAKVHSFIYYDPSKLHKHTFESTYTKYQEIFNTGFSHAGVFLAETEMLDVSNDISTLPILSAIGMTSQALYAQKSTLYSGYWAREEHPRHPTNLFSTKLFIAICIHVEMMLCSEKNLDILIPYPMSERDIAVLTEFIEDILPEAKEKYDFHFCNTIDEITPIVPAPTARQRLSIICYGVLSKSQMLILQKVSEPLTVATGDQSIIEALRKIPIYQVMNWKSKTRDNLLKMAKFLNLHELFQWWQLTSNYKFKITPNPLELNTDFYRPFIHEIARFYVRNKTLLTAQIQNLFDFIKTNHNLDLPLVNWIKTKIQESSVNKKSCHPFDKIEDVAEHYETIQAPLAQISYVRSHHPKPLSLPNEPLVDNETANPETIESSSLILKDDADCYLEYDDFSNTLICARYNHLGVINAQELFEIAIKKPQHYPRFHDLLSSLLSSRLCFVTGTSSTYFYTLSFFLCSSVYESIKYRQYVDRVTQFSLLVSTKYWLDAPQNLIECCQRLSALLKTNPIETWTNPIIIQKIDTIMNETPENHAFSALFLSMYSACFSYNRTFREQIKTWLTGNIIYNTQHQFMLSNKDIIHPAAFIDYPCTTISGSVNTIFLLAEDESQQALDLCYTTLLGLLTPTQKYPLILLWHSKSVATSTRNQKFLHQLSQLRIPKEDKSSAVDLHFIASEWETIALTPQINYLLIDANVYYFTEHHPFLQYLKTRKFNITAHYLHTTVAMATDDDTVSLTPRLTDPLIENFNLSFSAGNTIKDEVADLLADNFPGDIDEENLGCAAEFLPTPISLFIYKPPFKVCVGKNGKNYLLIKKPTLDSIIDNKCIDLDAIYETIQHQRDPELLQSMLFYFNHLGYRMKSEKYSEQLNLMALVGLIDAGTGSVVVTPYTTSDDAIENEWFLAQQIQRTTRPPDLDTQLRRNWIGYHDNLLQVATYYLSLLSSKEVVGSGSVEDKKWLIYQLALTQSEITPRHVQLFNTWININRIDLEDDIILSAYLKLPPEQLISSSEMDGDACSAPIILPGEKIVILTVQYKKSHGDLQNAKKLIDNIVSVSKQSLPIYWIVFSNNPPHYLLDIEKKITKLFICKSGEFAQLFKPELLQILNHAHLYHSATAHHFPKTVHLLLSRLVKDTTIVTEYDVFHEQSRTQYISSHHIKTGLSGVGIYIEEPKIHYQLIANLKALSKKNSTLFYAYFNSFATSMKQTAHISHLITTLAYCNLKNITDITIYGNAHLTLNAYKEQIKYYCSDLIEHFHYVSVKIHPKTNELELMRSEALLSGTGYFNVTYINPFFEQVDASVCSSLVKIGENLIGGTGDHSLFGIILEEKLPLYETVPWKNGLLLSLIYLCEKLELYTLRVFFGMQRLQVLADNPAQDLYTNAMQLAVFLITNEIKLLAEIKILAQHIRKHLDLSHTIKPKIQKLLLSQKEFTMASASREDLDVDTDAAALVAQHREAFFTIPQDNKQDKKQDKKRAREPSPPAKLKK